jgi:hypothetical protein
MNPRIRCANCITNDNGSWGQCADCLAKEDKFESLCAKICAADRTHESRMKEMRKLLCPLQGHDWRVSEKYPTSRNGEENRYHIGSDLECRTCGALGIVDVIGMDDAEINSPEFLAKVRRVAADLRAKAVTR